MALFKATSRSAAVGIPCLPVHALHYTCEDGFTTGSLSRSGYLEEGRTEQFASVQSHQNQHNRVGCLETKVES